MTDEQYKFPFENMNPLPPIDRTSKDFWRNSTTGVDFTDISLKEMKAFFKKCRVPFPYWLIDKKKLKKK